MVKNNFNIEKFNRFESKAESISTFNYRKMQHKIDYENKLTNCYGFVTHLFPFLKEATHSRISVRKKVNDFVDIKIQREPTDYCFIMCLSSAGFYTHIAVYVNGKVYEFEEYGYIVSNFSEFMEKYSNRCNFFTAVNRITGEILNEEIDFYE